MYSLGWRKDIPDARDYDATPRLQALRASTTLPASARNADLVRVVDQGQLGSCTANATGQAIRAAELLEEVEVARDAWIKMGNDPSTFDSAGALATAQAKTEFWSRLMMYWLARAYDGEARNDAGAQIRNVFQAVNQYGYAPESAWPYDIAKFTRMPPANAFRLAYDQRDDVANEAANLIDYERITSTGAQRIQDIQTAVAARHLVVFGTPVTVRFASDESGNGGNVIEPPSSSDPIAGGHALCVGGYDQDGAEIVNSWSVGYGGGGPTNLPPGWCKFSWSYLTWSETTDLWIVKRAPIYSEPA